MEKTLSVNAHSRKTCYSRNEYNRVAPMENIGKHYNWCNQGGTMLKRERSRVTLIARQRWISRTFTFSSNDLCHRCHFATFVTASYRCRCCTISSTSKLLVKQFAFLWTFSPPIQYVLHSEKAFDSSKAFHWLATATNCYEPCNPICMSPNRYSTLTTTTIRVTSGGEGVSVICTNSIQALSVTT